VHLSSSLQKRRNRFRSFLKRFTRRYGGPVIRARVLRPTDPSLHAPSPDYSALRFPEAPATRVGAFARLNSSLCQAAALESPAFRYWCKALREDFSYYRKLWEWAFVCQALYERDCLQPGRRGLGFAVGREALPSLFASFGCEIVGSDLPEDDPRKSEWDRTRQWAEDLAALNRLGICPQEAFEARVAFHPCDMNHIPEQLRDFDFTWSSCAFEHCGSLELGKQFILNQVDCLKPGGVAVHTTEFNLTSNTRTLEEGQTVIFRRDDMEDLVRRLRSLGHEVEPLCLDLGRHRLDRYVDEPPYDGPEDKWNHLRLHFSRWAVSSVGLIIRKRGA